MRELSLFSGAGGGLLGTKLLGFKHIGYVEYNDYCQRIIAQRIKDGILDEAPIYGDIRTFISEGYADAYSGLVDVITAGFPCQPFSVAGKQKGQDDERNMWPATIDVIRTVRPRFTLLENVPGLLAHEYVRTIFRDLAESGYECRWRVLSAAEVGAPHKRDRVFIVANNNSNGIWQQQISQRRSSSKAEPKSNGEKESLADSEFIGRDEMEQSIEGGTGRKGAASEIKHSSFSRVWKWWDFEPDVGRVADGVASRVDRLKALGNGQVPAVVRAAWEILTE